MYTQIIRIEYHLINLFPGAGIVHLCHSWQAVLLQLGSDARTVVLDIPHIVVFRHGYQVTTHIDIVVGPYLRMFGQGVTVQLKGQCTSRTGVCQALDAVILNIENQVAGDIHIQFGKDNGNLALGKPVVQFPEHLTMDGVLVFNHRTFLDVRNGKLRLVIVLVNLCRDNIALEIGIGTSVRLREAHTIRFQTSDIITSRHMALERYDDLGKAGTTGFQHFDAHLLMVVGQEATRLHRIFHVG